MKKPKDSQSFIDSVAQNAFSSEIRQTCKKHKLASEGYRNFNANLNDALVIIFSGYVKAEKGYEYWANETFPFYRIVYTISGQAKLKYPNKTFLMKGGTICGFPPKDTGVISVETNVPWEHFYLQFTGKDAAKVFNQSRLNTKKVIDTSNPYRIQQCFENILEEERQNLEFSHLINVHYLRALLMKLSHDAFNGDSDHSQASRETYLLCRHYINKHFSDITNFQELADGCNISKVYFCRIFKRYASISPMTYVMNLKMNKAAVLLMQTEMSIKQVCQMLQFEDQCYFSKLFKKNYGISPKDYRKKNQ